MNSLENTPQSKLLIPSIKAGGGTTWYDYKSKPIGYTDADGTFHSPKGDIGQLFPDKGSLGKTPQR